MNDAMKKPDFKETVELMHQLLRGQITPEEAATRFGAPVERVAIYQEFVKNHVKNALEKNYAVLARLLPADLWGQLLSDYFQQHPPWDYELNANAGQFRDFLRERVTNKSPGLHAFHVELAELEWQEWLAFSSADEIPAPSALDKPAVNPTLAILEFDYPVSKFVDAWREARRQAQPLPQQTPEKSRERVFLFRDPLDHLPVFYKADDSLLFAFKLAYEETGIQEAASLSGLSADTVGQLLKQAAHIGLLVLPETP
jgi:hypothetical protein